MLLQHQIKPSLLNQSIKLGIVANPNAGKKKTEQKRLAKLLPPKTRQIDLCITNDRSEVPEALDFIFDEKKCNVLGIIGGDGTINTVLNELFKIAKRRSDFALPPIAIFRGGTLNMLARAIRVEGTPHQLLAQFMKRYQNGKLGELPIKRLPLLMLSGKKFSRIGFIYGSKLTAVALQIYEELGGGYTGLLKFFNTLFWSYLTKNEFWQKNAELLSGESGSAFIEGQEYPFLALTASTIDIKLLGGMICGLRAPSSTFSPPIAIRLVRPQPTSQLLSNLPNLVFGKNGPGIEDFPAVSQLTISSEDTLSIDGEIFELPPGENSYNITPSSWKLPLLAPFP